MDLIPSRGFLIEGNEYICETMAVVGIMDSGVGGLSVFREIRKVLPEARFVYYSDNASCPYGDKTEEYIQGRLCEITDFMLSKGAEVMVLACNTATAAGIAMLRERYDIPFIGMEPAVKPAALGTKTGVIGVLATAGTLKASKYLRTRGQYEEDVKIVEHVGRGFVELVESGCLKGEKAEETVMASLEPLLDAGSDTVVLGCTHYPFLLNVLRKVAANLGHPDVRFIDPAPAVARQLVHVMEEKDISKTDPVGGVELVASGCPDALKRTFELIG